MIQIQLITDTDRVWRRVRYTNPSYIRPDQSLTSFAFKCRKGEASLSVDVERLTTYARSIADPEQYRLYALQVSDIRNSGLACVHDPLEENDAHALITGNITESKSKQMALLAKLVFGR